MAQHHPPTPPTVGDYQPPLQVQQYDVEHVYPYDDLSYGSPVAVAHEGIPSQASHGRSLCREGFGLGIQYAGYGGLPTVYHDGPYVERGQTGFSPPTPRSTTEDDIAVRSSLSEQSKAASCSPRRRPRVDSRIDSPRVKATPRVRKAKAKTAKGDKSKTPKLTAPLSILTRDFDVEIKDMESWVNRSAEERRKEALKRDGYITRPMNSFMLYRSAYAERAKAWCAQENHQVVSSVAGESWPLEPPEIREQYNNYAKIERLNHANAHPAYKFSPSKVAPTRKRKNEWPEDGVPSDVEDEWWTRRGHNSKVNRSFSYVPNSSDLEFAEESPYAGRFVMDNRPAWEMPNTSRPLPLPMHEVFAQYYQPHMYAANVEAAEQEALQFSSSQGLLGLPGGHVLMQQLQGESRYESGQVDPMLLGYDGGHVYHGDQSELVGELVELRAGHDFKHDYNTSWQSDPTMSSMGPESEFDKWVGEH